MDFLYEEFRKDGLDINNKENQHTHMTPIMIAAKWGNRDCVKWLIKHDAELHHTEGNKEDGKTAADLAEDTGYKKIAEDLRKAEKKQNLKQNPSVGQESNRMELQ